MVRTVPTTKGRLVWQLIDDVYRRDLARMDVKDLGSKGLISAPYYYQLKNSKDLPDFDMGCYLALGCFGVFLGLEPSADSDTQQRYRRFRSWDVIFELSEAYARDFAVRCERENFPIDRSKKVSSKLQAKLDEEIVDRLILNDDPDGHAIEKGALIAGRLCALFGSTNARP